MHRIYTLLFIGVSGCTVSPLSDNATPPQLDSSNKAVTDISTFCTASILDTRKTPIPYLPKPKSGVRYIDPALGATVVKISDSNYGEIRKPAYSTMQAWNADESLLLLYKSIKDHTSYELRDGHTYQLLRQLNLSASDIEEIFWSRKSPNILFYISSAKSDFGLFNRLDIQSGATRIMADFSPWCGNSLPVAGNDVQMQSYDDDSFAFRCTRDKNHPIMFSYRISTDKVTLQPIGKGTPWSARTAPTPTPSGQRFWYQGKTLSTDLRPLSISPDISSHSEHSSIGTTASGHDALYQVAFNSSPAGCNSDPQRGVGHLVQHNLETGECRNLISEQHGYPYPTSSTHVSALSTQRPGLVAMSSIGSPSQMSYLKNNAPAPPLLSEIYLAETTERNTKVCRLAHHRSFGKNAVNGGYNAYFGEPHATISPSGTRIIFGSDWYDSGSVDSYVIELPDYRPPVNE